jgi:nitrile hydratase subunit beta
MNGIHDLGGMHGFGRVDVEPDEPVFHARWEGRVFGMVYQVVGLGWVNLDAFRHGIERTPPVEYLTTGYYGRWLASLSRVLVERGVLAAGEIEARVEGRSVPPPSLPAPPDTMAGPFERPLDRAPRFRVGDAVRARVVSPVGHTRLPRYVAGRCGVVTLLHAPCVFPDTNADERGEQPQHLYNVRFAATELWGESAEPATALHIDLFEPYLEPAR